MREISRPIPFLSASGELSKLNHLLGKTLCGVYYSSLMSGTYGIPPDVGEYADEVDRAILLDFGEEVLRIDWAMSGRFEALSLMFGWTVPSDWITCDAGGGAWADHVGETVTGISLAWQDVDEPFYYIIALLGIRLSFSSGKQGSIVLGEMDNEGKIRYQPDSLLAMRNQAAADNYIESCKSMWKSIG